MKFPKKTKRYCPYCKEKTEQKIKLVGTGFQRGTMTRGSLSRAKKRGLGRGIGNKGRWGSRPAQAKHKRKSKTNKKTNVMYTCSKCGKSKYRQGRRNKRTGKQVQE
jgi:ribosomal protein L44E